jgi:hypothetical protein
MEISTLAGLLKPYIMSYLDVELTAISSGDSGGDTSSLLLSHIADTNIHHPRLHNVVSGFDHQIVGNAFDLLGAVATNTIGLITPSYNTGASSAIVRTDSSGAFAVQSVTLNTLSSNTSQDLVIDPYAGNDVYITSNVGIKQSNPAYPLDVTGAARVTSKVITPEVAAASTNLLLTAGNLNVDLTGYVNITTDNVVGIVIDRTENAGVDTAYRIGVSSSGGDFIYVGPNSTTAVRTYEDGDTTITGSLVVGSNTQDNSYKLKVAGNVKATAEIESDVKFVGPLLTNASDLKIESTAGSVRFSNSQTINTLSFDSSFPIEGWQISETAITNQSQITIGVGVFDELRVKIFVADETRVDRGNEYWTKSYGILAEPFVTPGSIGGTVTITFEDSPALSGALFSTNDWLLFQVVDIDTGFVLLSVWGQVSSYTDLSGLNEGKQTWTYTHRQGPTDELIRKGQIGVDFGATGAALIHLSTVDPTGAPYIKMRKWAGANPYTPANFTTYVQIGELGSVANATYDPVGYGLYVRSNVNENQFIVADNNGIRLNNTNLKMYDGATQTVNIDYTGTDVWIGNGSSDKVLFWDGSTFQLLANNSPVITLDTSGNSYFSGIMTIGTSGEIRQGTGTLGSTYTGLRIWRDSNIGRIAGYNTNVLQWYADTNGKLNAGAGNVQLSEDGIDLEQDGYISPDAARAITWWTDVDTKATLTQSISAFFSAANQNVLLLGAYPQGGLYDESTVVLDADGVSIEVVSDNNIFLNATFTRAKNILSQTHNTYDLGDATNYWNDAYITNLHVTTIVGTPSYSHSHAASDITSGVFSLSLIPATLTGKDADTVDGYHAAAFALSGHTHSYLPLAGGAMSGNITFSGAQTVDGVDISAFKTAYDAHHHNSLYVPLTRTVAAGLGLTGGGALSSDITITHGNTSSQTSVNNSSYNFIQDITLDDYGHVTALGSADASAMLAGYVKTDGTTTGATSARQIFTNGVQSTNNTLIAGSSDLILTTGGGQQIFRGVRATTMWSDATSAVWFQIGSSADYVAFTAASGTAIERYGIRSKYVQITSSTSNPTPTAQLDIVGSLNSKASVRIRAGSMVSAPNEGDIWLNSSNFYLRGTSTTYSVGQDIYGDTLTLDDTIEAASNIDTTHELGRAKIGYAAASDSASFSHYDFNSSINFALAQYSTGSVKLNVPTGQNIGIAISAVDVLTITEDFVNPRGNMQVNLGDYNRKYRSIHSFEFIVDNLVASSIMATIGGRIIITDTIFLNGDMNSNSSYLSSDYSSLGVGDYGYMAAYESFGIPQVEVIRVIYGPTGMGPFSYIVERDISASNTSILNLSMNDTQTTINTTTDVFSPGDNLQLADYAGGKYEIVTIASSGSSVSGGWQYTITRPTTKFAWTASAGVKRITKNWAEGNAIASMGGAVGEGYIELTSTTTLLSQYGPTISITSRSSTATWNALKELIAIGNLRSRVDYGSSDTYGMAIGNDTSLTPTSGFSGITADATNGIRLFNLGLTTYDGGSNSVFYLSSSGALKMGLDTTDAAFTSFYYEPGFGTLRIGPYASGKSHIQWDGADLLFKIYNTTYIKLASSGSATFEGPINFGTGGGIYQGSAGSFASPNTGLKIWRNGTEGEIALFSSTTKTLTINSTRGIDLEIDTADGDNNRALSYRSSGTTYNWVKGYNTGGWQYIKIASEAITGLNNSVVLRTSAAATKESSIFLSTTNAAGSTTTNYIYLHHTTGGAGEMELLSGTITIYGTAILASGMGGELDLNGYNVRDVGKISVGVNSNPLYGNAVINGTLNSSADGGHLYFKTTQDAYPTMQLFNWQHDNIAICFDTYYDSAWIASDATGFQIYKLGDALVIRKHSGSTPGSAATMNNLLTASLITSAFTFYGDIDLDGNDLTNIGTLGDGWVNVSGIWGTGWGNFGSGYQGAQYKRVGDLIILRGMVARTSGVGTTILTMPSGYRPPDDEIHSTTTASGAGTVTSAPNGVMTLATGSAIWVSLSGVVLSTSS